MKNRRTFLLTLTAGLVALAVLAAPVIAEELFGVITKVDVDGKKLTVTPKGEDKDIEVTVTDETEYVSKKGAMKLDLEKLAKSVAEAQDAGKKGDHRQDRAREGRRLEDLPGAPKKKEAPKDEPKAD